MRSSVFVIALFFVFKSSMAQTSWTSHQTNSTTPLLSVIAHSANYWIATDTNGVIQTTGNAGNTWVTRNSGTQVALHDIANPLVSNFVCIGDSGVIKRSTDYGVTWLNINSGTVGNLRSIHFSNGINGLAVGHSGTILRTTNGGSVWQNNSISSSAQLEAVVQLSSTLAFAAGHQGTIVKSNDGGTNWQNVVSPVSSEDFYALDFWNSQTGICAGTNGTLLLTNDGGVNWTLVSGFTTGTISSVKFRDINTVFCSTSNGEVFYSTNRGMNWVELIVHPQSLFDFNMINSGDLILVCGTGGIVYRNLFSDWYNSGIPGSYSASFINDSTGICKGTNGILYYMNSSRTWDTLTSTVLPGYFAAQASDSVIHLSNLNSIYTSRDHGQTWTSQTVGNTSSSLGEIMFCNDTTGFFAGDYLYRTIDGGYTWTLANSALNNLGRIEFFDHDTGYFVSGSTLYFTDNGGITAKPILFNCDKFHFANKNFGTAFMYNSIGVPEIWLTKNGGRTFIKLATPPVYNTISDVHFTDTLHGYISGTGSLSTQFLIIHKTSDGGKTWTLQSIQNSVFNHQRFYFASESFGVITGVPGVLSYFNSDQAVFNNPNSVTDSFVLSNGPGYDWIIQSSTPVESYWQKSATQKNGNLLISGFYKNGFSWGPHTYYTSPDTFYQFLAEVNSTGLPSRLKLFRAGSNYYFNQCMGVDGAGNIYLCGNFSQFIVVDSVTYTANTGTYWMKTDSLFNVIHFQLLDSSQFSNTAQVKSMSVDTDGNCYLFLNYSYNYTLQNHTFTSPSTIGFVKLDSSGVLQWANQCDNQASIYYADIAIANDSSLWISGSVFPDMNIDGDTIPYYGFVKNFIGRLDPQTGSLHWLRGYGVNTSNLSTISPGRIAPHPDGNLYFCGAVNTFDALQFDSLHWSNHAEGLRRSYIGEIDANGSYKRIKTIQSIAYPDIAIDPNGKLYLSGINPYRIDDTLLLPAPQLGLYYAIIRYNADLNAEWLNTLHFIGNPNQLTNSRIALFDTSLVYNVMLTGSWNFTTLGIGGTGPSNSPIYLGTAYKLTLGPVNPTSANWNLSSENSELFSLSPNPSHSTINLILQPTTLADYVSYSLYDATGKMLLDSKQINATQTSIDVNWLNPGIYFIQVKTKEKTSVLKFIKQ